MGLLFNLRLSSVAFLNSGDCGAGIVLTVVTGDLESVCLNSNRGVKSSVVACSQFSLSNVWSWTRRYVGTEELPTTKLKVGCGHSTLDSGHTQ